jgi:hypothetical protein
MNDVPNSYAYAKIREKRKDAFLEKGYGFGKTYTSSTSRVMGMLPTLRIDYIFTDPNIQTSQFTQITKKLSDHQALVADIKLKIDAKIDALRVTITGINNGFITTQEANIVAAALALETAAKADLESVVDGI